MGTAHPASFLMTGHSDSGIQGETILWADASLESLQADYKECAIRVCEGAGGTTLLRLVLKR